MAVERRDIFAEHVPVEPPNHGLLQENPETGRQSTSGARGSENAHGDVGAFRRAQAAATGEKPGGSAGFGLQGDVDTDFSTKGYNSSDTPGEDSEYGKGIAGTLPLSTAKYNSSDTPSETSEYGKGIGGDVDKTLTLKKGI